MSDLMAFLYQRMRDYCIDTISSRWAVVGANVWRRSISGTDGWI
jgi:hypothetical protein